MTGPVATTVLINAGIIDKFAIMFTSKDIDVSVSNRYKTHNVDFCSIYPFLAHLSRRQVMRTCIRA